MITSESNESYHANPAIGSTSVKAAALNSVAHWHGAEFKSSPAMDLGSAVHANYLEPEKFLWRCTTIRIWQSLGRKKAGK